MELNLLKHFVNNCVEPTNIYIYIFNVLEVQVFYFIS